MDLTLQVSCPSLSDEEMHVLTGELAQTVSSETGISAQIPEQQATPGAKGDAINIGTLILTFFSSGAAVALIGVLKSYFDRASNLTIDIKRPDGTQFNISAENMKPEQIENTVARLKNLLGN
jgi:hypothetical protein